MKFAWLFLAGGCGAVARTALSGALLRLAPTEFPWGTFIANAAGCFLFGVLWAAAEYKGLLSEETKWILLVGFMGSFTTFSTFAFESHALFAAGKTSLAVLNLVGQNVLGLLGVAVGIWAVRTQL